MPAFLLFLVFLLGACSSQDSRPPSSACAETLIFPKGSGQAVIHTCHEFYEPSSKIVQLPYLCQSESAEFEIQAQALKKCPPNPVLVCSDSTETPLVLSYFYDSTYTQWSCDQLEKHLAQLVADTP